MSSESALPVGMNVSGTADNGRSDYSDDSDGDTMYRVRIAAWVTATLLVLATNVPLIIVIMKQTSRTFLDWIGSSSWTV